MPKWSAEGSGLWQQKIPGGTHICLWVRSCPMTYRGMTPFGLWFAVKTKCFIWNCPGSASVTIIILVCKSVQIWTLFFMEWNLFAYEIYSKFKIVTFPNTPKRYLLQCSLETTAKNALWKYCTLLFVFEVNCCEYMKYISFLNVTKFIIQAYIKWAIRLTRYIGILRNTINIFGSFPFWGTVKMDKSLNKITW